MPSLIDFYSMPVHQDAEPLDVEDTIKIQAKMNYKDHVIYRVIGAASLIAFLLVPYYAAPHFLDQAAAKFESNHSLSLTNFKDPQNWCIIFFLATGFIVYPFLNLVYMAIYKLNHPFFEQFKDNSLPWPWQTEPVKFRKQVIKAIKLIATNNVVYGIPFALLLFKVLGLTYKFSLAELPSL